MSAVTLPATADERAALALEAVRACAAALRAVRALEVAEDFVRPTYLLTSTEEALTYARLRAERYFGRAVVEAAATNSIRIGVES